VKLTRAQVKMLEEAGVEVSGKHNSHKPSPKSWPRRRGKKPVNGESRDQAHVLFDQLCEAHGIPTPDHEYEFCPPRKFRFDCVFDGWLALEIQGGNFCNGRHVQPASLLNEYEKLNLAVIHGYSVLFCTRQQIDDGSIFPTILQALAAKEEQY
jgi:hypothetical protein